MLLVSTRLELARLGRSVDLQWHAQTNVRWPFSFNTTGQGSTHGTAQFRSGTYVKRASS